MTIVGTAEIIVVPVTTGFDKALKDETSGAFGSLRKDAETAGEDAGANLRTGVRKEAGKLENDLGDIGNAGGINLREGVKEGSRGIESDLASAGSLGGASLRQGVKDGSKGIESDLGDIGAAGGVNLRKGVTDETAKMADDVGKDSEEAGAHLERGLSSHLSNIAGLFSQAGIPTGKFGKAVEDAGKGAEDTGGKVGALGGIVESLGGPWMIAAGAVGAVGAASLDMGEKMQKADAAIAAASGTTVASATRIGNAFLDTAGKSEFSGVEMAAAFAPVAGQLKATEGAALDAKQAMQVMGAAGDLATAKQISLADATSTVAGVMQAFQLKTADAAHVSDVLFTASSATGQSVDGLASSLEKVRSKLGDVAPPIGDLSGLLVDMTDHGITGRAAMASLNGAMNTLLKPVDDTTKAGKAMDAELHSLGLTVFDSHGKFVGLGSVIEQLAPKFKDMTQQQQLATATTLFGASAARQMTAVIDAGAGAYQKATAAVNKHGAASEAAAKQSHTLSVEMKTLKADVEDVATKIGEALIPILTSLAAVFVPILNLFIEFISFCAHLVGLTFTPLILAFNAIKGPVMDVFKAIEAAVESAWTFVRTTTETVVNAIIGFFSALPTKLQGFLNTILSAFNAVWNTIKGVTSTLVNAIVAFFSALPGKILGFLNSILGFFTSIWNTIKTATATVVNAIVTFFSQLPGKILAFLQQVLANFVSVFATILRDAGTLITNVVSFFGQLPGRALSAVGALVGDIGGVFTSILNAAGTLITNVVSFFAGLPAKIVSAVSALPGDFVKLGQDIVNAIVSGIQSAGGAVLNAIDNLIPGPLRDILGIGTASPVSGGVVSGGTPSQNAKALGIQAGQATSGAFAGSTASTAFGGGAITVSGAAKPSTAKIASAVGELKSKINLGPFAGMKASKNVSAQAASATSYTPTTFAIAVLEALGIQPTPENVQGFTAWEQAEGGNWNNAASYNPLNTTQGEPGASSMNSVGVKAYTSWAQGIAATVSTLKNGYYGGIIGTLKQGGSPSALSSAVGASPWGTGNFSTTGTPISAAQLAALVGSSGGGSSAAPATGAEAMLKEANALVGAPYSKLNAASAFTETNAQIKQMGVDCAGLVSVLLKAGGVAIKGYTNTEGIPSLPGMATGAGKNVTVYDRNQGPFGNQHTLIDILGKWFESGGNSQFNPSGGVSQLTAAQAAGELGGGGFNMFHPTTAGIQSGNVAAAAAPLTKLELAQIAAGMKITQQEAQLALTTAKEQKSVSGKGHTAEQKAAVAQEIADQKGALALQVATEEQGVHLLTSQQAAELKKQTSDQKAGNTQLTKLQTDATKGSLATLTTDLNTTHTAALAKLEKALDNDHNAALADLSKKLVAAHTAALAALDKDLVAKWDAQVAKNLAAQQAAETTALGKQSTAITDTAKQQADLIAGQTKVFLDQQAAVGLTGAALVAANAQTALDTITVSSDQAIDAAQIGIDNVTSGTALQQAQAANVMAQAQAAQTVQQAQAQSVLDKANAAATAASNAASGTTTAAAAAAAAPVYNFEIYGNGQLTAAQLFAEAAWAIHTGALPVAAPAPALA